MPAITIESRPTLVYEALMQAAALPQRSYLETINAFRMGERMELIDQGGVIDTNILIYHLTDCLGDVGDTLSFLPNLHTLSKIYPLLIIIIYSPYQ